MFAEGYKALKALTRSRSLRFTRDYLALGSQAPSEKESAVAWWSGDGRPVHYRRGTSDVTIAYDVLFKPGRKTEYWLPEGLDPGLILDIGANVGIVARYLAHRFPTATIHSFEPIPENYRLLCLNAAGSNVTAHPYGLGSRAGTFEFRVRGAQQYNRGSYSLARNEVPGDAMARERCAA